MHDHILPHYDAALNEAARLVLELGQTVLSNLDAARNSLLARNDNPANEVIANQLQLHEQARYVQSYCTGILSRFHPLAKDLRLVISLTRIADKLEECAEEVASLTRRVRSLLKSGVSAPKDLLEPLFEMARAELQDSLQAIGERNRELALNVRARDKELDIKHREMSEQIITQIETRQISPAANVDLLFIVRSLERVGDNAKSLSAAVVFITDAEEIRHTKNTPPA